MRGRIAFGSLLALALVVGGPLAAQEQEKERKDDQKGGMYTLTIKRVEVQPTQENGEHWDVNDGLPDLTVCVENMSDKEAKPYETKEMSDTATAEFNAQATVKFKEGQMLKFKVLDKDIASDDMIGETQQQLDTAKIKNGKLKLEKFGQVISLEIELRKA